MHPMSSMKKKKILTDFGKITKVEWVAPPSDGVNPKFNSLLQKFPHKKFGVLHEQVVLINQESSFDKSLWASSLNSEMVSVIDHGLDAWEETGEDLSEILKLI